VGCDGLPSPVPTDPDARVEKLHIGSLPLAFAFGSPASRRNRDIAGRAELAGTGQQELGKNYIFRRPAANVLLVTNANRTPYAMLWTSSAPRNGRSDRYEIVLGAPSADGAPRRLEAWFAPGEIDGQQLIYPKAR
jgi:hypothetical protein